MHSVMTVSLLNVRYLVMTDDGVVAAVEMMAVILILPHAIVLRVEPTIILSTQIRM
jgi:hypothetical protein